MGLLPARRRRRVLQVGFVIAGGLAVVLADRVAVALLALQPTLAGQRAHAVLVLGGRVLGGWAVGMAFRLQLAPRGRRDDGLRWLVGVPAALLCVWPLALTFLPSGLARLLPLWATAGVLLDVQTFAAVVLGLVMALGVTPQRS